VSGQRAAEPPRSPELRWGRVARATGPPIGWPAWSANPLLPRAEGMLRAGVGEGRGTQARPPRAASNIDTDLIRRHGMACVSRTVSSGRRFEPPCMRVTPPLRAEAA